MQRALSEKWTVTATWRRPERKDELTASGIRPIEFDHRAFETNKALNSVTHILVSIAPGKEGDPVLTTFADWLKLQTGIKWIGYLSSTNVYGDHGGAWVDETSTTQPSLERGKKRLNAEKSWTAMGAKIGAAVHIFRLAGIYGPDKNAVRSLLDGKAKRTIKKGQVFSRIHREDIAQALWLAAHSGQPSNIFNLADDLPSPPQDVITKAAELLGITPPPAVNYEDAGLSPMGRSFYEENKRVSNQKAKDVLGWSLQYPDYHHALPRLIASEKG